MGAGTPGPCREHASVIESQRRLLGDRDRNQAFAEAIRRVVRPGSRVADLGTGTGFLAILCERAGARSVWACDLHPGVVKLARSVAKDNGCSKIRFTHGHSTQLAPPEPVDVIVSEVLGHFAGEEHLVESLTDAQRWLAPGGVILPNRVDQFLCPVIGDAVQSGIDVFADHQGVDLRAVRAVALSNGYVRTLDPHQLLERGKAAQRIDRMVFPGKEASRRRGQASWKLPAGPVYGLALWWEAELVPGITLSTSPLLPPTHWEQIYLPLRSPLQANAGDVLEVELSFDTRFEAGCAVVWSGKLMRGGRKVGGFEHDNRFGCL
jgi:protein arginine N-methyltransferase 1